MIRWQVWQTNIMRLVGGVLTGFVLVACANSRTAPTPTPDLVAEALDIPGVHLALAIRPPRGYELVKTDQVYAYHRSGQDIWLYASDLDGGDSGEDLSAWLSAIKALRFTTSQGSLYWIPAEIDADRLAFAENHGLIDSLDPRQGAMLWRERGNQMRRIGAFSEAVDAYHQALATDPQESESYVGLGAALLGLGRSEEALPALQRAVELLPDDYWAHRLLGNVYLHLQRYPLAADELTQAYLLNSQEVQLLIGIALAQGRSGQQQLAFRTLDQLFSRTDDFRLRRDAEALRRELEATVP